MKIGKPRPFVLRIVWFVFSLVALQVTTTHAGVAPSTSSVDLEAGVGDTPPSGTVTFAADADGGSGFVGCGFYDFGANPITPSKLSLQNGEIPSELAASASVDLTFACNTDSPGVENVVYGCNSDQGIFFVGVSCSIPPAAQSTVTGSGFMLGVLDGPNPTAELFVQADEDLTNVSCGFAENDTLQPVVPSQISLVGDSLPASLDSGNSATLAFSCDATTAGDESLTYLCDSDQGAILMDTQCTITASSVNPWFNSIQGVRGNPAPTWEVEFEALNTGLTNLDCDFNGTPSRISLVSGSIPSALPQGSKATLEFSCDTTTAGNESFLTYGCSSDQGDTYAFLNCDIRERNAVEPLPESGQLTATQGAPDPTVVVDMTADGADVTSIQSCGFYQDSGGVLPITPATISLQSGAFPGSLAADQSVQLTFACDASYQDQEEVMYGCGSDQGFFSVPVQCDIQEPPVALATVFDPGFMFGVLGSPDPSAEAIVQADEDLTNVSCGFVDNSTLKPVVPNQISLVGESLPASLGSGNSAALAFSCDATIAGSEWLTYRCDSDQGSIFMDTICLVNASSVNPWINSVEGVRGNPAPTWEVEFEALNAGLTNLDCDFNGTPSRINLVSGSIPSALPQGSKATLEFSCDTTTAGNESFLTYGCSSDQGDTYAFLNCDIRERNAVEPLPESGQLTATQGAPDPTVVVDMTAGGADVTNIVFCGFYPPDGSITPITPDKISLQSGAFPGSLAADQSVQLTFACDASYQGQEEVVYGCGSDQGIFSVPLQCDIQQSPPPVLSLPDAMSAIQGQSRPTAQASVLAASDLTGLSCSFYESYGLATIVPAFISLDSAGIPGSLDSGNSVDLVFGCNTASAGSEDVLYGCTSDQGGFNMPVSCEIAPDTDADGVPDDEDAFPDDPTETLDTDKDGLGNNKEDMIGTDPEKADSDGDGFSDGDEVDADSDPLSPDDVPVQSGLNIILIKTAIDSEESPQ